MKGVFPQQLLRELCRNDVIRGLDSDGIQPASLDLSVAEEGYAVPGSMLPLKGESVRDLARAYARRTLDLESPNVLVRGEVYVVRLRESLNLPSDLAVYANSKSSTGRIDLQTRMLCDGNPRYDKVPFGYRGELWLELIPKSFDVRLRAGDSLNQAIFFHRRSFLGGDDLEAIHATSPLLYEPDQTPHPFDPSIGPSSADASGILMTINLDLDVVGFVAKKSFQPVDLAERDLDPAEYFEPILRPKRGALFLSREAFYILSTHEFISIPPLFAVEMLPYDTSAGEFRAHYAGFFDPGFGYGAAGEVRGTPAVLEVRPYEDDLILRHRQPVCRMAFEDLVEAPHQVYGAGVGSHYAAQRGPKLAKYFRES
ncbi:MAG: 2'-deoxycytidine 5'-triphosphate deaminase [Myxococcota bacterium]